MFGKNCVLWVPHPKDISYSQTFHKSLIKNCGTIVLLCHITDKSTAGGGMASNRLENKTNIKRIDKWLI